jgi:membrane associated rhomboid family serine protease
MGFADRHYNQPSPQRGYGYASQPPSRLAGSPVVKWLLISNVAIFFIDILLNHVLSSVGHFSVGSVFEHGQVWRILTFQFLHADLGHIAFNMFALYMFGSFVEQWWGSRKFLVYYLLCGASGALFYSILYQMGLFGKSPIELGGGFVMPASYIPLVGASAGIFGCLVAVAVIAPNLQIRLLFPPIPMKMKTFALGVLGIAVVVTVFNLRNAGGEAGHLGGAILGYLLMKNPWVLGFVDRIGGVPGRGRRRVYDATVVRETKIRPRTHVDFNDTEVDRILDKVNREGIQSLTESEREILRRSSGN